MAAQESSWTSSYVEEQLVALRGVTMYPEVARLRALIRSRQQR